jgi:AcrR family transcriptional regulator
MAGDDRRAREREIRHRLITDTARTLAEREGWDAVTTRRLAAEIGYSQPVIYKHFASMEALNDAVALAGFGELADALADARRGSAQRDVIGAVARAYSTYADENPAVYDAMFSRTTALRFADESTPPPLTRAYEEFHAAVTTVAGDRDADTLSEVLWAALHGLTTLSRNGRLRPSHVRDRIDLLVAQFSAT